MAPDFSKRILESRRLEPMPSKDFQLRILYAIVKKKLFPSFLSKLEKRMCSSTAKE